MMREILARLERMEQNMELIRNATHQIGSEVATIRGNCLRANGCLGSFSDRSDERE